MAKRVDNELLKEYQALLNEAAGFLLDAVQQKMGLQLWTSAYTDIRWFPDKSGIGKSRILLPDDTGTISIRTPPLLDGSLDEAWEIQTKLFPDKWYGVLLVVYPDGRCETKFNYDPDCGNDPNFFTLQNRSEH